MSEGEEGREEKGREVKGWIKTVGAGERGRIKFRMRLNLKLGSKLREGEEGREGEGREVKGGIKMVGAGQWTD